MHTRGEERVTSCTPSKDFKNTCDKNAIIKHENREPLDFLTTPIPPLKIIRKRLWIHAIVCKGETQVI
jgi:hypothetical protein